LTADTIVASATGTVGIRKTGIVTTTVDHSFTVYAKAGTARWVRLSGLATTWFDLVSGVVGTSTGTPGAQIGNIQKCPNGWYRCHIFWVATTSTTISLRMCDGDGVNDMTVAGSTLHIWGAQLETGQTPSSYIPTTTAQVTRVADVPQLNVGLFPYVHGLGTLVAEAATASTSAGVKDAFSPGGGSGAILPLRHQARLFSVVFNGSTQADFEHQNPRIPGQVNRAALAYQIDDFAASWNGNPVQTDNLGTFISTYPGNLNIGQSGSGTYLMGHVRKVVYLPRRVSNDELVKWSKL
jgi:hypothetical protein